MKKKERKINNLVFKRANLKDVKIFFKWRNDISVRKNSNNKRKIRFKSHYIWFKKKLKSTKSLLFILKSGNKLIGQIRLDQQKKRILISYSIDKNCRNRGFGLISLKKLERIAKKYFKNKNLYSKVKKENIASNKIFTALNYKCYYKNDYFFYKKSLK